jgi:ligand-binding SRPBCC domain-containing protein
VRSATDRFGRRKIHDLNLVTKGRTEQPARDREPRGLARVRSPTRLLERRQIVPVGIEEAFAFFADAWNLEAITPPWLHFQIVDAPRRIEQGSILVYRLRLFRVPLVWRTVIVDWHPPFGFTDVQAEGPYRRWEHTHRLTEVPTGTAIHDRVVYRLPYEPLASLLAPLTVRPWLDRIFDYRAERVAALLRSDDAGSAHVDDPST